MPSVYTIQCLTGKVDNNNNHWISTSSLSPISSHSLYLIGNAVLSATFVWILIVFILKALCKEVQLKQLQGIWKRKSTLAISKLSNLSDILGQRWFIRGLNLSGDFCYVKPGTVEFYLQHTDGKVEYQLSSDETLSRSFFWSLVLSFVCEDGTLPQWNSVLQQCSWAINFYVNNVAVYEYCTCV